MNTLSRLILSLTILTFAVSGLVSDIRAEYVNETSKTFTVSPGGQLYLDTDIGSVEIKTGKTNTIQVDILLKADTRSEEKAEKMFDRFKVDFEQDDEDLHITGDYARDNDGRSFWGGGSRNLQVRFYITIPEEFDVDIETSGGSISIDDLNGEIKAKTAGGSLTFSDVRGSIKGSTSGGSIELSSCVGPVDVRTSGGSITIGRVEGDVFAHTSGGGIVVEEVMGAIDASTSGGGVKARITQQPKDDCRLVTSGGSVTVYIDPNLNFNLDAVSSAGHISTDFPVRVSGRISKSSLQAEINDGGPELYLRTSGGNININEI